MQPPDSKSDQRALVLSASDPILDTAPMMKKRARNMCMDGKEITNAPDDQHAKYLQPQIPSQQRGPRNSSDMTAPTQAGESFEDADINESSVKASCDDCNGRLSVGQKSLIRTWHENFAQPNAELKDLGESIGALALLIRAHPTLVQEFLSRLRTGTASKEEFLNHQRPDVLPSPNRHRRFFSDASSSSIAVANAHLPAPLLALVQKYITTCRRQRSLTDGRRTVNKGPFRCTFGCGYHTARAFDWRRHEETHEPQELWLCSLCYKFNTENPCMVSRKDKFLRHARDFHSEMEAEKILDESKVQFTPKGDLRCGICGEECRNWEDRCRHILAHFEKEKKGRREKRGSGVGKEGMKGKNGKCVSISESQS
ncbi:hypothetical protein J1614_004207 [Plenodomus biglobosus]|nr:hypothetical protein J1614_004207 [Plenodomus biglobosus]